MNILFAVEGELLISEPIGIMCLSSILKQAGHNVDIVEGTYAKVRKRLNNSSNSTILAYSANAYTSSYYLKLNRRIKEEFKVLSVFGGSHPTSCPEMIEEEGVDGICIGEGDYALLDLVNNLARGKPITNIANWWIKQDGRVFRNPPRPLIEDLNSLPFLDRTLFNNSCIIYIITSRGCPYRCSFCAEISSFRRRSVDNVIAELKEVKAKSQARFVYFCDPTFNISPTWLREFSEKYRREIGLPFYCYVRADLLTPEVGRYLKQAGCYSVGMGVETANGYLRNEILKKGLSKEEILSAAQIIKRHKIRLLTYNMVGLPFASLADDLETLKLNIRIKPDYGGASLFTIYKNTDIYNLLIKHPQFKEALETPPRQSKYNLPTARKIKNLHKLFGLTVEFPFLLPFVKFLIRLPLERLYSFLFLSWQGYCRYFRSHVAYLLGWRRFIIRLKKGLLEFLYYQ